MQTLKLPGFIGGSYRSEAIYADVQRCVNWYAEIVESGQGENSSVLYPTPGTSIFGTNPTRGLNGAPRGIIELNGQVFCVFGTGFYEIHADGSITAITDSHGNPVVMTNDGMPVSMAANNIGQIFICSGGNGYCYGVPAQVNTPNPNPSVVPSGWTPIPNDQVNFFGCSQVAFLDDYFIVLIPDSSQIQVSALNDGTTWNGAAGVQIALVEGQADHLAAITSDKEFLYLWGSRRSEIWYNSGAIFPFQIQPGAFMEQGTCAQFTVQQIDNSIMWLGQDARGSLVAWRANGFTPVRISTHAVEYAWQQYLLNGTKVSDARAFVYQQNGHTFYVLTFPSADATWVYDVTTKLWHERCFTDSLGKPHIWTAQFHAFGFGQHLVQVYNPNTYVQVEQAYTYGSQVHVLSPNVYTDFYIPFNVGISPSSGSPIVRDRITPHIYAENKRFFCNRIEVRALTGVGLEVPSFFNTGTLPQMMLKISKDGGDTWGEENWRTAGAIGNYMQRIIWNLCPAWRDGVLWFRCTDPANWCLIDCYITGELGVN